MHPHTRLPCLLSASILYACSLATVAANEAKSPDATPAGNVKNMAYRVPPELLKGLPAENELLHGIVIKGEERVIYHRKHSMLLVKATDQVHAVVSQRVDRLQSQAQQRGRNTSAEKLADALDKAFSKFTTDIARELLRQVDVLIQEGKYAEAKNLLRASERRVKEKLAQSSADERTQWLGLQSETQKRLLAIEAKDKQGSTLADNDGLPLPGNMPTVKVPKIFDDWKEKSASFEFNGMLYYHTPLHR